MGRALSRDELLDRLAVAAANLMRRPRHEAARARLEQELSLYNALRRMERLRLPAETAAEQLRRMADEADAEAQAAPTFRADLDR